MTLKLTRMRLRVMSEPREGLAERANCKSARAAEWVLSVTSSMARPSQNQLAHSVTFKLARGTKLAGSVG